MQNFKYSEHNKELKRKGMHTTGQICILLTAYT